MTKRTLSIVIPALNEEQSIGSTVARCREARSGIVSTAPVDDVEIIVVSDGSDDGTERIALSYPDVTVLVFEQNRGYGAALKCGFEYGNGELVGFLDADGTCDPRIFSDLCTAVEREEADVALGSRLNADSRMPFVRVLGNSLFAWMLGILSQRRVRDTASGMRVIRREALAKLYPLPDGLHFTPAMSARILIGGDLSLVEVPMPYHERSGQSKLSVVRDGLRFLWVISQAAVTFRPARLILMLAVVFGLAGVLAGLGPLWLWLREGFVEEWMIHRTILSSLLLTIAALLISTAVTAERIAAVAHRRLPQTSGLTGVLMRLFTSRTRWVGGFALMMLTAAVVWPAISQVIGGTPAEFHWSRAVLAALLVFLALALACTTFLLNMMDLIQSRYTAQPGIVPADRVRPAKHDAEITG
jgi:glycosyltransferase involved in cell wall biosynthesis